MNGPYDLIFCMKSISNEKYDFDMILTFLQFYELLKASKLRWKKLFLKYPVGEVINLSVHIETVLQILC